ncbi:MAG: hypothetical protein M3252_05890 [Actinomycetota bacterium]|nr:hypothetical protein [Actinomycetota bacterium]
MLYAAIHEDRVVSLVLANTAPRAREGPRPDSLPHTRRPGRARADTCRLGEVPRRNHSERTTGPHRLESLRLPRRPRTLLRCSSPLSSSTRGCSRRYRRRDSSISFVTGNASAAREERSPPGSCRRTMTSPSPELAV